MVDEHTSAVFSVNEGDEVSFEFTNGGVSAVVQGVVEEVSGSDGEDIVVLENQYDEFRVVRENVDGEWVHHPTSRGKYITSVTVL